MNRKGVILTSDAVLALALASGLLVLILSVVSAPRPLPSIAQTELFLSDFARLTQTGDLNEADARAAFSLAGQCGSARVQDDSGSQLLNADVCACPENGPVLADAIPVYDVASGTGRIVSVTACPKS